MNQRLLAASRRFEDWIKSDALPLWQSVGLDESCGAHYERLLADGQPDKQCDVRARVQARQMFVFAFADQKGWVKNAYRHVNRIDEFVNLRTRHPSAGAGYVHLLDANFQIKDSRQDLYDHAFFLLAYAWVYKAFGHRQALDKVEELVRYLDSEFASLVGGWDEGDYQHDQRRQNPHMHLFEVFLNLYSITGESQWLARAAELFSLFQTRFYDADKEVLLEYFDDQWSPVVGEPGKIVEPGHMLEWVWLLRWYERLSGRPVSNYVNPLYKNAIDLGMTSSGLIVDAVDTSGKIIDGKKRCWPMTELIKANIAQARSGDKGAEEAAALAIENLFEFYLACAKTPGAYIDQRGEGDEIIVDHAPASTLYHLIVAAAEVNDYCNGIGA